jgi:exopolysaccharide biosynthesis polyprenyl glycosylphosphotransferase
VFGVERVADAKRVGDEGEAVATPQLKLTTHEVARGANVRLAGPMASARAIDRVSTLLLLTDIMAILLACALVPVSGLATLLLIAVLVVAFQGNTLYRSRLTLSLIDELPVLMAGVAAAVGVSALVTISTTNVEPWRMVLQGLLVLGFVLVARAGAYWFVRLTRRRGWVAYRTLIVGTGPTAARVKRTLDEHPEHGLRVVGFMGPQLENVHAVQEDILEEDPVELAAVTVEHDVAVVIITYVGVGSADVLRALRMRDPQTRYTLFLVPPLFQMLHSPRRERIRDVALIRLRPALWQLLPWRLKRLMDLAFSLVAIALLSPIMALTALAVRLEMGPDVLFRQTRVGSRGRPFTLFKFRSLKPANANESATNWSVSSDSRIGPVGRFIRKTSLDELPQLLNILRGDMSLVGPRPERPYFVEKFNRQYDSYPLRHRVRPGLTGWAAVNGLRGDTSIEERAYFDNVYIDNWSLWLDVKIMARTFSAVLGGTGS